MNCMGYVLFKDGSELRLLFVESYTADEAKRVACDTYGIWESSIISAGYTGVDKGFMTPPLMKI